MSESGAGYMSFLIAYTNLVAEREKLDYEAAFTVVLKDLAGEDQDLRKSFQNVYVGEKQPCAEKIHITDVDPIFFFKVARQLALRVIDENEKQQTESVLDDLEKNFRKTDLNTTSKDDEKSLMQSDSTTRAAIWKVVQNALHTWKKTNEASLEAGSAVNPEAMVISSFLKDVRSEICDIVRKSSRYCDLIAPTCELKNSTEDFEKDEAFVDFFQKFFGDDHSEGSTTSSSSMEIALSSSFFLEVEETPINEGSSGIIHKGFCHFLGLFRENDGEWTLNHPCAIRFSKTGASFKEMHHEASFAIKPAEFDDEYLTQLQKEKKLSSSSTNAAEYEFPRFTTISVFGTIPIYPNHGPALIMPLANPFRDADFGNFNFFPWPLEHFKDRMLLGYLSALLRWQYEPTGEKRKVILVHNDAHLGNIFTMYTPSSKFIDKSKKITRETAMTEDTGSWRPVIGDLEYQAHHATGAVDLLNPITYHKGIAFVFCTVTYLCDTT